MSTLVIDLLTPDQLERLAGHVERLRLDDTQRVALACALLTSADHEVAWVAELWIAELEVAT